jgi:hypothetical protein
MWGVEGIAKALMWFDVQRKKDNERWLRTQRQLPHLAGFGSLAEFQALRKEDFLILKEKLATGENAQQLKTVQELYDRADTIESIRDGTAWTKRLSVIECDHLVLAVLSADAVQARKHPPTSITPLVIKWVSLPPWIQNKFLFLWAFLPTNCNFQLTYVAFLTKEFRLLTERGLMTW